MNLTPSAKFIVLPGCEYSIILRSFVLTQYCRVTDRQTHRNAITNTACSMWHTVILMNN